MVCCLWPVLPGGGVETCNKTACVVCVRRAPFLAVCSPLVPVSHVMMMIFSVRAV